MSNVARYLFASAFLGIVSVLPPVIQLANACSRAVFLGDDGAVITGRTMDWKVDVGTNLWILPRGVHHTGEANPRSLGWTSKYGSVIATGYEAATTDGMNEKGLVANALWLVESKYPDASSSKPTLPLSIWAQYMLDNFATVQEAVDALQKESFAVWTTKVPGEETLATLHFSLSDATGDSAIVEYVNGHQVIHHDRKFQVMTNSPLFEEQLALQQYWKQIGGTTFLPGANRAADRFARASFYINAIPRTEAPDVEVASVFSVMRNVSVPYGITTPGEPNISSTRWRTVADQKRKVYLFESALTPNTFWVNFQDVDFSPTGKVKRLDLGRNQSNTYAGNVAKDFKEAPLFKFLGY